MGFTVPEENVICLLDEIKIPPTFFRQNKNPFSTMEWN